MNYPRVLICGTHSGSGKTTAVCAILALLKKRGLAPHAFKCGPDYIDPMFHARVLSVPCTNLDPFFCEETLLRRILAENASPSVNIMEGVMGYYDGTGESGTENSSYDVARKTASPAVLILDGKGAFTSLLAAAEGFLRFRDDSRIAGVIFNRMSPMTYARLKPMIRDRFGPALQPLGFIPPLPEACQFGSRHLGLVTAGEIKDWNEKIALLCGLTENTLDPDGLLALAGTARGPEESPDSFPRLPAVRIAVAKDAAFCFYYHETFRMLERMGAELLPFSPLADEPLPENCGGLLLGGGYPELYAERLEANIRTKKSIRMALSDGMPAVAECGGFQYLGESIDGRKMCGILPGGSRSSGRLVRFGYKRLHFPAAGLFGPAGLTLPAHEFHYYDSADSGRACLAERPNGQRQECCFYTDTLYAGYPHLYLRAAPEAALAFIRKCLEYTERKKRHDP